MSQIEEMNTGWTPRKLTTLYKDWTLNLSFEENFHTMESSSSLYLIVEAI
jgi:hypothetical protein